MTVMIPRNTAFPVQRKGFFTTHQDNQTEFYVRIFEGEHANTKDNLYLGYFILDGLPMNSQAGQPKIEVIFDIDGNRELTVTAALLGDQNQGYLKMKKAVLNADWISKVNYEDAQSYPTIPNRDQMKELIM